MNGGYTSKLLKLGFGLFSTAAAASNGAEESAQGKCTIYTGMAALFGWLLFCANLPALANDALTNREQCMRLVIAALSAGLMMHGISQCRDPERMLGHPR